MSTARRLRALRPTSTPRNRPPCGSSYSTRMCTRRMAFATLVLVIYQGLFIDVITRSLYATGLKSIGIAQHSLYSLYLRASRYTIFCTLHCHFTPFRAPELQETLPAFTVRAATAILTRPIAIYLHPRRKHSPTGQFLKQVQFPLVHSTICHPTPT